MIKFDDGVTQMRQAATALFNFAWAVKQQEWATLEAAARLEFGEAWDESEPLRVLCMVGLEVMSEAAQLYASKSAFEQGEIQGRIALELAGLVFPATKAGAVSKLSLLQQLRTLPFVQKYPGLLDRIDFVIARFSALPPFCFVAGTLVHTEEGLKAIEEIRTGERVLARDEFSSHHAYKTVIGTVVSHPDRLYHLRYRVRQPHRQGERNPARCEADDDSDDGGDPDSSELVTSGPHPFFVRSLGRFLPARDLEPGHDFLLADGGRAVLESVKVEEAPPGEFFITYNFEVADYHTYFVGAGGVWVHNTGPDPCDAIDTLTRTLIRKGTPRRQAIIEAMKEVRSNAELTKIAERLKSASNFMLDDLPEVPSALQMQDIFTVADWKALKQNKNIRIEHDGQSWIAKPGAGDFRGHHIVNERIQEELRDRFGVNITDIDDSPVKVFTKKEHYGEGNASLHNRMNAWQDGVLHPNNLGSFQSKEALLNKLIEFYASDSNTDFVQMAKATRGWAAKHGIPINQ